MAYCCSLMVPAMGNKVANVVSMKLDHDGYQESSSIRESLQEFS